jgi:hypothetical protein
MNDVVSNNVDSSFNDTQSESFGVGDNGQAQEQSWYSGLPEDIQSWSEVKNSKDPESFWNQMSNMRSRMGRSLTIPSEDAGDDVRNEFRQKLRDKVGGLVQIPDAEDTEGWKELYRTLGTPEDVSGYKLPEGIDSVVGSEVLEGYANAALEANIPAESFQKFMSIIGEREQMAQQAFEQETQKDLQSLKQEWGLAFDERIDVADKVIAKFAPHLKPEDVDSKTIKALYSIGKALGGETMQVADQGKSASLTVQEANMRISEIRNNPNHPYHNQADPSHKAAREMMRQLYKSAYPDEHNPVGAVSMGIG